MKRFLYCISCFLLPLLLVAVAGERYVRAIPNSYRLKSEWMTRNADSVETLILGNSHAYYGIRPQELDGVAFNLASVSQTAPYDRALLQHYAPMCPRLRQVVLVVDNSYLFDAPLEQTEPSRCACYTIYMGVGPHSRWSRYGCEILQFDGFVEKLKAYRRGKYAMCDTLGWGSDYTAAQCTFTPEDTAAVSRRLEKHLCRDWRWARENARQVEEVARYCRLHALRLAVVQTPVCAAYGQGVPEEQRRALDRLAGRLASRYGVTVLDFSSDSRFSGSDFFDADHLSDIGASRFTRLLGRALTP